jgi:D-serine deaminase-like pyridoxal phosphate-dependent protein
VSILASNWPDLQIRRPTLLLDPTRARRHIEQMADKAARIGVRFKPHFKTHQSAVIGGWFRALGVRGITVSSLDMARYFAADGWQDITVAFPFNTREREEVDALAPQIDLHLIVDSMPAVEVLGSLTQSVHVWIKVDVGGRRAGVAWSDEEQVQVLAEAIRRSEHARFKGLLTHAGHSYDASSVAEILDIHASSIERLTQLQGRLEHAGIAPCEISIGDTPCCSLADGFDGVSEIRPGNFVFYDLMQARLGSCRDDDIAVAIACPVVGTHPERKQVVLYGGAVHLSKDGMRDERGRTVYGYLAHTVADSWGAPERRAPIVSLSQEHGIVELDDDLACDLRVGDLVTVLPIHSCLTSDLYTEYRTPTGEHIPRRRSNDVPA